MQEKALAYVRALLIANGVEKSTLPGLEFRRRSKHIERVCLWLERLAAQGGVPDLDALRLAAAFHDVGYIHGMEAHAAHGAEMLRAYALEQAIPVATAERAAFLVSEHSNKARWLPDPDAPRDLVLLMEADLLDEEGAMGIALDCMSVASRGATDYEDAYARMLQYEPERLRQNPMVTPLARAYWAEKQQLIRTFLRAFAFDLGMEWEEV